MKIIFLSSANYTNRSNNCGDCILIDNIKDLIVYDCGCDEHAERVLSYMQANGYSKVKIVLSHNDSDHFNGINFLIEKGVVEEIYTLLLLKHTSELLEIISDGRMSKNSISEKIKEIYENISSLSKKVVLKDTLEFTHISDGVEILGPSKEYTLNAVAKNIDSREGDTIDKETIVNAVSTQLLVNFENGNKLLLTGDSSFAAIENSIKQANAIQLPHHGKLETAESIFEVKDNNTIYFVSDNTGNSNGGSEDLRKKHPHGYAIQYTTVSDIECAESTFNRTKAIGAYFRG